MATKTPAQDHEPALTPTGRDVTSGHASGVTLNLDEASLTHVPSGIAGLYAAVEQASRSLARLGANELVRTTASLNGHFAQIGDQVQRLLAGWLSAAELNRQLASQWKAWGDSMHAAVQEAVEQARMALPQNWRDLEPDEFERLLDLAKSGEIALVWVPRTTVLRRLIQATTHEKREAVLQAHRTDVLDDVDELLGQATIEAVPEQGEMRDSLAEAVAAARCGHDRAAQALSAAALGRALHALFGFERLGAAYKKFKDNDPREAAITQGRIVCLQVATANALSDTKLKPRGFNRHGTQHGDPAFFSESAMLAGLLLMAGWVREFAWLAEHHPEVFIRHTSKAE